jgi:hypothetical protein
MIVENTVFSIKQALESMKVEGKVTTEALWDCLNHADVSLESLEAHLTKWLWVSENAAPYEAADMEYVIQLGEIEEFLVMNSLIYKD